MKEPTPIPNKLYFRIGEVADLLSVKPYVLRYWETEFPEIKPAKSKSGQRLYKRKDVEMLVKIKELLYQERFTINGARRRLKELVREHRGYEALPETKVSRQMVRSTPPQHSLDQGKVLVKIRKDLEALLETFKP